MENGYELTLPDLNLGIIHIRTHSRHLLIYIGHILYCKADGSYTKVFVEDDRMGILVSQPLTKFQKCIPEKIFLRCHNSYLINLKKVQSFSSKKCIIAFEGKQVPISRRRANHIFNILLDLGIKDFKNGDLI